MTHRSRAIKDKSMEYPLQLRPDRELSGKEYDHMSIILGLLEPTSVSNNQRTLTEVYKVGDKTYNIRYRLYDDPMITEVLPSTS